MTSWVVTIDATMPDHWVRGKIAGFWDLTRRRDIRAGDDLFFWLTAPKNQRRKGRLIGWATATSDAFDYEEHDGPWRDFDSGRVTMIARADDPVTVMLWSEMQPLLETRSELNSAPVEISSAAGQVFLRSLFPAPPSSDFAFVTPGLEVRLEELDEDLRTFTLQLSADRVGQAQFRANLIRAYNGRCAMSGTQDAPALQAAHIIPFRGPQTHAVTNGLLLRADLHTLFDMWLITVTEDLITRVSPMLTSQTYRDLDGQPLRSTLRAQDRPDAQVLRAHNEKAVWLDKTLVRAR